MKSKHFIKELKIKNFKSIKDCNLQLKRVNIFVGKPNVGKSNFLEAITMLDSFYDDLEGLVRVDKLSDLFYMKNTTKPIQIESDSKAIIVTNRSFNKTSLEKFYVTKNKNTQELINELVSKNGYLDDKFNFEFIQNSLIYEKISRKLVGARNFGAGHSFNNSQHLRAELDENLDEIITNIKNYKYVNDTRLQNGNGINLQLPFGENLLNIIESNSEINDEMGKIAKEYGYIFYMDFDTNSYQFQKMIKNVGYKFDKLLLADTLKRYIFYFAAIKSNYDSIIVLEEPESHCYPKYIAKIGYEIMNSLSNQFFIATHSPYLIQEMMNDELKNDVAIHVCSFDLETSETKVRTLTENELKDISDYQVELFLSIEDYEYHG